MHMDKPFLAKVDPVIRDNYAWEAFELIIKYHREKELKLLEGILNTDQLVRINARLNLLTQLLLFRDHCLSRMNVDAE